MSNYDEEQAEQLKKWWKENWKALAAGLVIGIGGIFGWEGYKTHKENQASEASRIYDEVTQKLDAENTEEANALFQRLASDYKGTPYADQAALAVGRSQFESGKLDDAIASYKWVQTNSSDSGLRKIAQLQHARALWEKGEADAALAEVKKDKAAAFDALFLELQGDIQLSKGDRAAAREAYEKALKSESVGAANREFLERKLEDVAVVGS